MSSSTISRASYAALGLLPVLLLVSIEVNAQQVGVAAASNTRSVGTPPSGATRVIELGAQVVRREKIETSATGSVQLLFIDKTSLNIGPNSTLIIDEFVFDPAANVGRMTASLARGALRVVGGQASHTGGATFRTPTATIGIRGGIATIAHCVGARCAVNGTRVVNHFGRISVQSAGGVQEIRRPGFAVTVAAPTTGVGGGGNLATPSAPVRVSQGEVDSYTQTVTSRGTQTGGARQPVSDAVTARLGVNAPNANVAPTIASVQGQTASEAVQPALRTTQTQSSAPGASTVTQAAVNRVETAAPTLPPVTPVTPVPPVTPVTPVPPVTSAPLPPRAFAMVTSIDPALGSNAPFLVGTFAGSGSFTVSPIYGYRVGGSDTTNANNTIGRTLQANLRISGTGPTQTSTISVATGAYLKDDVFGNVLIAGFSATTNNSPAGSSRRANGAIGSVPNNQPGSIAVDGEQLPTGSFTITSGSLTSSNSANVHIYDPSTTAFTNAVAVGPDGLEYRYNQTATRVATPTGLGDNRPAATLNGFAAGLGLTVTDTQEVLGPAQRSNLFIVSNSAGQPGNVSVRLQPGSSRLGATFNVNAFENGGVAIVPRNPADRVSFRNGSFEFGSDGQSNRNSALGTYVDYDNFAGRGAALFQGGAASEISTVNGQPLLNSNTSIVNPRDGLLMVTSNTVNAASLFPGVELCNCEYTRWGFWSVATNRTDGPTGTITYSDRGHLLTWVAGRAATAASVPTIGSATYTGHVVASITRDGRNDFVAASNFSNAVNFATGRGTVSVPNLDGSAYSGAVNLSSVNRVQFTGTATAAGGRTMAIDGAFLQGRTNPVGEMAGQVRIAGPGAYLGAGTFAARAP